MDSDKIAHLKEIHKDKDTKELMAIWMDNDTEEWDKEALAAMEFILIDRGEELPHGYKRYPKSTYEEIGRQRLFDKKKSVDVRKDCEPSESEESLDDASYNELREMRRYLRQNLHALDQSNEHLNKIRVYIGWFWWILIGIPLTLIIIAIFASIKFESMKKERQLEQEQQQEQSGQGTE